MEGREGRIEEREVRREGEREGWKGEMGLLSWKELPSLRQTPCLGRGCQLKAGQRSWSPSLGPSSRQMSEDQLRDRPRHTQVPVSGLWAGISILAHEKACSSGSRRAVTGLNIQSEQHGSEAQTSLSNGNRCQ